MHKKTDAQKTLIDSIKGFISKNRCSLPNDDIVKLENCILQFENSNNVDQSTESEKQNLNLLDKAIEILVKYFLFKEIHDFFDN